ncbi:MAG: hypothetical protein ACI4KD_03960 [Oscillospiraceae bacterium]
MDYSFLISFLRQKQIITDLEKDFLDTANELNKSPFDKESAEKQVNNIYIKYPDIFAMVSSFATTVQKPSNEITEEDVKYNLIKQLAILAKKVEEAMKYQ